jgi:hypothetical protein
VFSAWETKDREALEGLLAEDFTFTSPNDDDPISKQEYWQKCWPGSEKIHAIRIEKLFEKGDEAFVRYECELKDGARFRNTEYFRIEGNKNQGGRGLLRIICKSRRLWCIQHRDRAGAKTGTVANMICSAIVD